MRVSLSGLALLLSPGEHQERRAAVPVRSGAALGVACMGTRGEGVARSCLCADKPLEITA